MHRPDCLYFRKNEIVKRIGLALKRTNALASTAIEGSLALQITSDSISISPHLTLRGVPREDSPAFDLFYDLGLKEAATVTECIAILRQLPGRLQLLFANGEASPTELDETGSTLFHVRNAKAHIDTE